MPKSPYKHLRLLKANKEIIQLLISEDRKGQLTFQHAALAMVSFPYRNHGTSFERKSGPWGLSLKAGSLPPEMDELGFLRKPAQTPLVPYGPRARLILLALQTEALRKNSREVDVRPSFTSFAKKLGLSTNNHSLRSLRAQMLSLSLVHLTLRYTRTETWDLYQGNIFSKLHADLQHDPAQRVLWPDVVVFSHDYFESLKEHALPLQWEAVSGLRSSARNLDWYCFLAYRLHALKRPTPISWKGLQAQFSDKLGQMSAFQRQMKRTIKDVSLVYPKGRVDQIKGGVMLWPSPPPVKKRF
jgi:hypothetical protein